MGFLGVYRALYSYTPQGDQEIALHEGDLLYVLEKSIDDEWWKAKRKSADEDGEEPIGLIPSKYIQEAEPTGEARALYDYVRQTDEELSLAEDAALSVYDTSDPDWTLVGRDGEYGFAPANYIELRPAGAAKAVDTNTSDEAHQPAAPASLPPESSQSPALVLAGIMNRDVPTAAVSVPPPLASPASSEPHLERPIHTPEASDDDEHPLPRSGPSLPFRPSVQPSQPPTGPNLPDRVETPRVTSSPPFNRAVPADHIDDVVIPSPGGFRLYHISEMVSVMGKRKKLPTTLGVNIATGTIMVAPEKSRDGPQQEWTAEKLTHYSVEGKHLFMELVRPSKSVDFHAGTKDTAEEIVSALGEIAGAVKAEGLREVLVAGSGANDGRKRGQVLYDFVAQGDDEVTVGVGDEVIILDLSRSEEWWMVRRVKDGKEGVMPSSYVDWIRRPVASTPKSDLSLPARTLTEPNRIVEEQRPAREAARSGRPGEARTGGPPSQMVLGVALPQRGSSLVRQDGRDVQISQKQRQPSTSAAKTSSVSRSKPDPSQTRVWTDRSGSFKVEAEFIGCSEGKIHLHKLNGVKIAVPVAKMAIQDLEFVERMTGLSLEDDKPLAEIKRRARALTAVEPTKASTSPTNPTRPATSARRPEKDEYDWFDFFLKCGVSPQLCERYASSFSKDSMDESVLPDITAEVLRTLGLKEGDILKVMKRLDTQHGRTGTNRAKRNVSFGGTEVVQNGDGGGDSKGQSSSTAVVAGLFSGPGGALRNNTRKGRPAPAIQTKDVVDPKAFELLGDSGLRKGSVTTDGTPSPTTTTTMATPPAPVRKDHVGFDDDAWDVKPPREQRSTSVANSTAISAAPPQPQAPTLTGGMKELSLLSPPLEPTIAHHQSNNLAAPVISSQPAGANTSPGLPPQPLAGARQIRFTPALAPPSSGATEQGPRREDVPTIGPLRLGLQPSGFFGQQPQSSVPARLRPPPPPPSSQPTQNQGSMILLPPPRPFSAPQNKSLPTGFTPPPLQPQLTGVQGLNGLPTRPDQIMTSFQLPFTTGQPVMSTQPPSQLLGPNPSFHAGMLSGPGLGTAGLIPQPTGFMPMQGPPSGFMPLQSYGSGPEMTFSTGQHPPPPPIPSSSSTTGGNLLPLSASFTGASPFLSNPGPPPQSFVPGGINAFLPPALLPQATGIDGSRPTLGQSIPPPPPMPQANTIAPLVPQRTGPAPPVRFGFSPEAAKRLIPQPTGRRANLSQATPQNPFGF